MKPNLLSIILAVALLIVLGFTYIPSTKVRATTGYSTSYYYTYDKETTDEKVNNILDDPSVIWWDIDPYPYQDETGYKWIVEAVRE